MKRLILMAGLMCLVLQVTAQNISVTFTGTGAATRVDSVNTTNLTTGQSVTLPGNDTLVLTGNTGIPTVPDLVNPGMVYPNPFSGQATFNATVQNQQTVFVKIQNLVGQVIAQSKVFAQPGDNQFSLSVKTAGIYMITLTTDQGTSGYKIICIDPSVSQNSIEYFGFFPTPDTRHLTPDTWNLTPDTRYPIPSSSFKTSHPSYTLRYTEGNIMLYRCMSGIYTTIVTDSLISSKNYEVEFVPCTDPDGKNYSIVKIGEQNWMAENLAYLPAVSPPSDGSETSPFYYVNGYEGSSVSAAKQAANFTTYGVLYNWEAAKTACPAGWHLPTPAEWNTLTDYLTNNGYGYGGSGSDIAKSMASTSGWTSCPNAGTIGNDQGSNNRSGFTALPGDGRYFPWVFGAPGSSAFFWSAADDVGAQIRSLSSEGDGVWSHYYDRSFGLSVRCINIGGVIPTLQASFTQSSLIGSPSTTFQFDASACSDTETAVTDLEVRWDWDGDGTWDTRYNTLKTASINFPEVGAYSVKLEVKNKMGLSDTTSRRVNIFEENETGTFPDGRETPPHEYRWIKIGTQVWMAENLAWLPAISPLDTYSSTRKHYYIHGYQGTDTSMAKTTANYKTYGVLYNQPAAMDSIYGTVVQGVQGACPDGWHLPNNAEWTILTEYLGDSAETQLKAAALWGWGYSGDNSSGFSALPGGFAEYDNWYSEYWFDLHRNASFWSAFGEDYLKAWYLNLSGNDKVELVQDISNSGRSIRCLKNLKPYAHFKIDPPMGAVSTIFQFDASGSSDNKPASDSLMYRWDWNGDGIWDTDYIKTKIVSHQFTSPATYTVRLEASNPEGQTDVGSTTVLVAGTFTDSRDGHIYTYKTIGTQTWMIENLAYLPSVSPFSLSDNSPYYYVYGYEGTDVAAAVETRNYSTFGALYNWEAAKTACPAGWHLPTDAEWVTLTDYLTNGGYGYQGSGSDIGKALASKTGWNSSDYNAGAIGNHPSDNNASFFNAMPGGGLGYLSPPHNPGDYATFWSATPISLIPNSIAWNRELSNQGDSINRNAERKWNDFSVRCLKDDVTARFTVNPRSGTTSTIFQFDASGCTDPETATEDLEVRWDWNGDGIWDTGYDKNKVCFHQYATEGAYWVILEVRNGGSLVVTESLMVPVGFDLFTDDRDGHEYFCKTIGTQTWMIENLAYLPVVSPSSTDSETEKLYHVYKYQGTSVNEAKESVNYKTYGVLYNWPAATNGETGSTANPSGVQGVCPTGWHLPSDAEWTVLTDYLGPTAGYKMKTTSGWDTGNGDNSSAFAALPAGYRTLNGGFTYLGKNAWFWTATADLSANALCRSLDDYFDGVIRDTRSRGYGYSVRCVRD